MTTRTAMTELPAIVAALLRPATYPHPARDIRLHETHISWVVEAGPYAYKVKKPVDLGFLDFSTVERRAAVCADEVRLNRRLCPDVCLEFSARYRCADVAAEVAFLAMDLDHYGRADLAAVFVDAYVRASGDAELTALLDFYRCYRAFVRGKVVSLRLAEPDLSPDRVTAIEADARTYFDLAWAYAGRLAGRRPSSEDLKEVER